MLRKKREMLVSLHPYCFYCKTPLNFFTATLDHVIPKSKKGTNNLYNLVVSCTHCNCEKGSSLKAEKPDSTYYKDIDKARYITIPSKKKILSEYTLLEKDFVKDFVEYTKAENNNLLNKSSVLIKYCISLAKKTLPCEVKYFTEKNDYFIKFIQVFYKRNKSLGLKRIFRGMGVSYHKHLMYVLNDADCFKDIATKEYFLKNSVLKFMLDIEKEVESFF